MTFGPSNPSMRSLAQAFEIRRERGDIRVVQAGNDRSHLLFAAMPRTGLPFANGICKIGCRLAGQIGRGVAFAAAVRTMTVCAGLKLLRLIAHASQQTASQQLI